MLAEKFHAIIMSVRLLNGRIKERTKRKKKNSKREKMFHLFELSSFEWPSMRNDTGVEGTGNVSKLVAFL